MPSADDPALWHAAKRFASAEFEAFKMGYEAEPVLRRQELRAGAIAWVAVALPEAFGYSWTQELRQWLYALHAPRRDIDHWFRVPALRSAVAVTDADDPDAVTEVVMNIDHHNASLRSYMLECLAFAAPMLSFEDEELRARVESVLQQNYLYSDCAIALLLATKGDRDAKTEWAKQWVDVVQPSFGRDQLAAAISGTPVGNPLFERLHEIERYSLTGLLAEAPERTGSLGTDEDLLVRGWTELIRIHLRAHPLLNPTFRVE